MPESDASTLPVWNCEADETNSKSAELASPLIDAHHVLQLRGLFDSTIRTFNETECKYKKETSCTTNGTRC